MMKRDNKNYNTVLLLSIAGLLGIAIGLFAARSGSNNMNARALAHGISRGTSGVDKLESTLALIDRYYLERVSTDSLVEELMPEVMSMLDPHSTYIPAADMSRTNEPLDGDLDPIRFEFDSTELVYPLALSQAATTSQEVYLYVLADHRQDVAFADGGYAHDDTTWARTVEDPTLRQRGAYLTAFAMYFYDPATDITGDLVISQAVDDSPHGTVIYQTNYVTVLGFIPMGWFLVWQVVLGGLSFLFAFIGSRPRKVPPNWRPAASR